MLLEMAELCARQLTLFADLAIAAKPETPGASFTQLIEELSPLFGAAFFLGQVTDATHPVRERRFALSSLTA